VGTVKLSLNLGMKVGVLLLANWFGWITFMAHGAPADAPRDIAAGVAMMMVGALLINFIIGALPDVTVSSRFVATVGSIAIATLVMTALLTGVAYFAPGFLALNANLLFVCATGFLLSLEIS